MENLKRKFRSVAQMNLAVMLEQPMFEMYFKKMFTYYTEGNKWE